MRLWDRLREWVDDESSSVQMYQRLSEASAMYQQGKTSLWRPPDLQLAINWRDQNKPTLTWAMRYNPAFERAMVYLRTSEKEYVEEEENKIRLQKRQMKRARIVAIILGTAAIISMGFMLFAFVQKIQADRQTILAEERKKEAEDQKIIADLKTIEANDQKILADSSAAKAIMSAAEAERQKLAAEAQKQVAVRNADIARTQTLIAEAQTDSATRAKELAIRNEKDATLAKEDALRRRMVSTGKAMAVKSMQSVGNKELQTLLAYQAYLFNKKNGGVENDADIYAGLYNVATLYGNINSGSDRQVLRWSLDSKDQTLQVVYSGTDIIEVIAVSPDESWLALGGNNSVIKMVPLKGNTIGFDMTGHKAKIKSLIFSFDGKYLYSASLDGKVLKWDLAARTSTNITNGSMAITSIDIASNGSYIAGISTDGNVLVWNPDSNSDSFRPQTALRNIKVIRFNTDNSILAMGDVNGNIELWDVSKRTKISEVKAHTAQVNDIRFNTTLKQMATVSSDKTIKIFNTDDLTELPITFNDTESFVLVIQFSPDGQLIVTGAYEGDKNLVSRPTHVDYLVKDICNILPRNMSQEEWNTYVGKDIPLEKTCADKSYNIKMNAIK